MLNGLCKAQHFAQQIRFSGDTLQDLEKATQYSHFIKDVSYTRELNISPHVTPILFKNLSNIYEKLYLPHNSVTAFVYASPEIQAECFAGNKEECVIRFSSALVDILNEEEFKFVAGHEIGHFLLGHGLARYSEKCDSVEYVMGQRAQEISADRMGLVACGSLNVAIKALMKTISGLTEHYLRFDVGEFLSQLRKTSNNLLNVDSEATHPSVFVRCRALLWFSLNDYFTKSSRNVSIKELSDIDKKIQSDLHKYVDGPIRRKIHDLKEDLSMWMTAYEMMQDKVFTKSEQIEFSKRFGTDTLESLRNFLQDISASNVKNIIYDKIEKVRKELETLIPTSFESEFASEISKIHEWKP